MLRSVLAARHGAFLGHRASVSRLMAPFGSLDPDRFLSSKSGGKPPDNDKKKRPNFDRDVLQRAARGELDGHESGIPKLAARKHKAHLTPLTTRKQHLKRGQKHRFPHHEEEEEDNWNEEYEEVPNRKSLLAALSRDRVEQPERRSNVWAPRTSALAASASAAELLDEFKDDDYFAPELFDDDKYYWREEEYEELDVDDDDEHDDDTINIFYGKEAFQPTREIDLEEDDDYEFGDLERGEGQEIDQEGTQEIEDDEELEVGEQFDRERSTGQRSELKDYRDPEQYFFFDQNDIITIAAEEDNRQDDEEDPLPRTVLPLRDHGPDLDDFLESVMEHPTAYARVTRVNLHPDSRREPKPFFPRSRALPPLDFVESHSRFLYVSGLPCLEVDGEVGDLENPVHRSLFQKTIARLVGVDSSYVFPANTTSGFVGFASPRELANALSRGPSEKFMTRAPDISMPIGPDADNDFVKMFSDRVILLTNMPPGNTSNSLARELFLPDTEVGRTYGDLSADDFYFLSATRVLVRLATRDHAESAVDSQMVRDRLKEFGRYPVRYFPARRELLHAGFGGPNKGQELRRMGPRLIVDGDMPSKKFFLSHASVIHLRNLDPTLTKEEISAIVQPFCAQLRDVQGSIEFVTCHAGLGTGHAYVGFDIPGEAETVVKASSGRMALGDRSAILRLVQDRRIPGKPHIRPEKRPERAEEELLDDLNNWEKYVDPADLEELEKAGIRKEALDDALRGIRFNNATFGALDSAIRAEALEPDKGTGDLYKELVQLYIQTLKECIATPEDVGFMYEALHFPDEDIDLSIFDREVERQKMLHDKRTNP